MYEHLYLMLSNPWMAVTMLRVSLTLTEVLIVYTGLSAFNSVSCIT